MKKVLGYQFDTLKLFGFMVGIFVLVGCGATTFSSDTSSSSTSSTAQTSGTNDAQGYIRSLQPALAVRAMGCVTCHASISSNVMTDFGYGGNAYFYNNPAQNLNWNSGSVYGDHGGAWSTISVPSTNTIYVPSANLPAYVQSGSGSGAVNTIADYVHHMLTASGATVAANPPTVKAISGIYIGAPTSAQILAAQAKATAAGGVVSPSGNSVYLKSTASSPVLAGLVEVSRNTFVADGSLVCEGELFINGTLLLANLNLTTGSGCHIYATQTVFVSGGVNYVGGAQANLQISSSRAISLGLGLYNSGCNAAAAAVLQNYVGGSTDSIAVRFRDMWTVPAYLTRDAVDPKTRGQAIVTDGAAIRASHPLNDAICEAAGRTVSFNHLLLNAPDIQSRYNGNFSGVIIAEVFIGALGDFVYHYDSVFSAVSVLPFLAPDTYLTGD